MNITDQQYPRVEKYFPVQRGNVSVDNLQVINAILYVAENGCKWRELPKSYGNWHTIYTRMNRWSKNGVLRRILTALQAEGIIRINVDIINPDNHSVSLPPEEIGTLKEEGPRQSGHPPAGPPRQFVWLPLLTDRLSARPPRDEKDASSPKE